MISCVTSVRPWRWVISEDLMLSSRLKLNKATGLYKNSAHPEADPGFFIGGGALVSCSTATPINHIVFFCRRTPCTLPLDPLLTPAQGLCPGTPSLPPIYRHNRDFFPLLRKIRELYPYIRKVIILGQFPFCLLFSAS